MEGFINYDSIDFNLGTVLNSIVAYGNSRK